MYVSRAKRRGIDGKVAPRQEAGVYRGVRLTQRALICPSRTAALHARPKHGLDRRSSAALSGACPSERRFMTDEHVERVRGTCVICRLRTDTSIGIRGPAEVPIALLIVLGASEAEARKRIADYAVAEFGCDPGMVPVGEENWRFVMCEPCAEPMNEPGVVAGVIATGMAASYPPEV
jgi:hypothetical protein